MPNRYVALLRGINVGGKNKLPMKLLTSMFEDAGCLDVASYIQSGNVVFTATSDLAATLPGRITARISTEVGFRAPIMLRSANQMAAVVDRNPMLAPGVPEDALHVMFLDDLPTPERLATLDPDRSTPDRFTVLGREVYLHLADGLARTKLTNAYFDSRLATTSTIRNWRTVLKLRDMLGN